MPSASIPGVFPPVFIKVEAGGKSYDDIHVDGGASSQVFLFPASLDVRQIGKELDIEGKLTDAPLEDKLLHGENEGKTGETEPG